MHGPVPLHALRKCSPPSAMVIKRDKSCANPEFTPLADELGRLALTNSNCSGAHAGGLARKVGARWRAIVEVIGLTSKLAFHEVSTDPCASRRTRFVRICPTTLKNLPPMFKRPSGSAMTWFATAGERVSKTRIGDAFGGGGELAVVASSRKSRTSVAARASVGRAPPPVPQSATGPRRVEATSC